MLDDGDKSTAIDRFGARAWAPAANATRRQRFLVACATTLVLGTGVSVGSGLIPQGNTAGRLISAIASVVVLIAGIHLMTGWRRLGLTMRGSWKCTAIASPFLVAGLLQYIAAAANSLPDLAPESAARLVAMMLFGALMIGLSEELMVRGVLFDLLDGAREPLFAVVVSALLFGLGHISNFLVNGQPLSITLGQVGYATGLGLAFAVARSASGTLVPLVLIHALFDAAPTHEFHSRHVDAPPLRDTVLPAIVFIAIGLVYIGCYAAAIYRTRSRNGAPHQPIE